MEHKNEKIVADSDVLMWFIIGLIPIINLILLWKVAKLVAAHESK